MRILTVEEMKKEEQLSNEMGVTFQRLMENAGCAAASYIKKCQYGITSKNYVLFCGNGNNGGDGFVVARKLFEDKANVTVVLCGGAPKTEEADYMYHMLFHAGIPILDAENDLEKIKELVQNTDAVVDAIFGTGFKGEISEKYIPMTQLINQSSAIKFALDIPSGVNASNGMISENAVKADYTIAFESLKLGHIIIPGKEYCGNIECVDIGIPHEVRESFKNKCIMTDDEMVFSSIKRRPLNSNKGTFGRLLCVVGSKEYPGAAVMSTMGALRTGAGITTVVTTERVENMILSRVPEATFYTLPENENGRIDISNEQDKDRFEGLIKSASAVLVGCGIGRGEDADKLVEFILKKAECTVILDADALYSIAIHPEYLLLAKKTTILTPHMGEMARIVEKTVPEVIEKRIDYACETARRFRSIIVLKDATTMIAAPNGDVYFNTTGNPGMSKGGSGDVLAGIISSLSAQGFIETASAVSGVYIHGLAGDKAAEELSQYGMLPTDIPNYMCKVFAEKGL